MYTLTSEREIAHGIYSTALSGLYYIETTQHSDSRGYYAELARIPELEVVTGSPFTIAQLNLAHSGHHVARGIHAEQWNKLITIPAGTAFCAFADITPGSATFGKVETAYLGQGDSALHGSFYLSKGIGNSLCVTEGPVDYLYAVDALYKDRDTKFDRALSLFDATLAIKWPLSQAEMIISERDATAVTLDELLKETTHA